MCGGGTALLDVEETSYVKHGETLSRLYRKGTSGRNESIAVYTYSTYNSFQEQLTCPAHTDPVEISLLG